MGYVRLLKACALVVTSAGAGCFGQFGDYTLTGSGAGGASTGTDGGGATGAGGAPTCTEGAEDCTNECDDDRDGKVDCEDADCGAFLCVEAPPTGWSGPATTVVAPPSTSCPAGTEAVQGDGTVVTSDGSATCECSPVAATGVTCAGANFTYYSNAPCTAGAAQLASSTTACTIHTPFVFGGVTATSVPSAAVCPGLGGLKITAPPIVERRQVCAALDVGGGCDPGQVCAPRPSSSFEPRVCVHRTGDTAVCPAPYDALALVVGGGTVDDQRSCPDCGYNPVGGTCNGRVEFYFDVGCSAPNVGEGPLMNVGCVSAGTPPNTVQSSMVILDATTPSSPPTCVAPANSVPPNGEVTVLDPRTVCCSGTLP